MTILLKALTGFLLFLVIACDSGNFAGSSRETVGAAGGADGNGGQGQGELGADSDADGTRSGKDGEHAGSNGGAGGERGTGEDSTSSRDDDESDIDILTDEDRLHTPKPCTGSNQVVIGVGERCPVHFAMYTMDDMGGGAQVPGSYVCCGLPARDVLSPIKAERFMVRSRTCGDGEFMSGVVDSKGDIYCSRLNTERYSLSDAKMICAGRKGGLFSGSSGTCGGSRDFIDRDALPDPVRQLVIGPLGNDGCVSHPYGSLVVKQGGKRCEDSSAQTLIERSNNRPVQMFP